MSKTTIYNEWAIGIWEQREWINYVSRDVMIDGRSACNCIASTDKPTRMEYDKETGIIYKQYESGNAPIFKTTITEE